MRKHPTSLWIRLASSRQIITEARQWPGVHTRPQRFGAIAICLNRRELGHLHGDRSADLPLERVLRDRLVSSGAAQEHRWRPNSGWVTIPLDRERDVFEVIALLRINYERARAAAIREAGRVAEPDQATTSARRRPSERQPASPSPSAALRPAIRRAQIATRLIRDIGTEAQR